MAYSIRIQFWRFQEPLIVFKDSVGHEYVYRRNVQASPVCLNWDRVEFLHEAQTPITFLARHPETDLLPYHVIAMDDHTRIGNALVAVVEVHFPEFGKVYIRGKDEVNKDGLFRLFQHDFSKLPCLRNCGECRRLSIFRPLPPSMDPTVDNCVALDCEMVWVELDRSKNYDPSVPQIRGNREEMALGRVSVVDHTGEVLLDLFVKPAQRITDYATQFSGLREEDLRDAWPYEQVRELVIRKIQGRMLVVHDPRNDFYVLRWNHPQVILRDTSNNPGVCMLAKQRNCFRRVKLRTLARHFLARDIQTGAHCSVEDARAAMGVYQAVAGNWHSLLNWTPT